jgi:HNH endonuclease
MTGDGGLLDDLSTTSALRAGNAAPDFASLYPGYDAATCYGGLARRKGASHIRYDGFAKSNPPFTDEKEAPHSDSLGAVAMVNLRKRHKMPMCIFCERALDEKTKPEHILHAAFGGRKTTRRVICSGCNNAFGGSIDKILVGQFEVIRNLFQMKSGSGGAAPMLRKVKTGSQTINVHGDGNLELVTKPFTIAKHPDGRFDLSVTVSSLEEMQRYIPNIAASLGISEEQVREQLAQGKASMVEWRPPAAGFGMTLGGPDALRSAAKACLVLWALKVGNDNVRGAPYAGIRNYILNDDPSYIRTRTNLDTRVFEDTEKMKRQYGPLFNLIYVRSDDAGRVIAHLTIYNLLGFQIVLADSGGTPSQATGLVSNPLNPGDWSDKTTEIFDLPFEWLAQPQYNTAAAKERFCEVQKVYYDIFRHKEVGRLSDSVFDKYGLGQHEVIPEAVRQQVLGELFDRVARHLVGIPYEVPVAKDELRAALEKKSEPIGRRRD